MTKRSLAAGLACLAALGGCMNTREPEELEPLEESARKSAQEAYGFNTTVRGGGVTARLWVPAGESASAGTWQAEVTVPDSGAIAVRDERNGTIANVWLRDLGGDGKLDLIVATNSAGSGSHGSVSVHAIEGGRVAKRAIARFDAAAAPGYRGHDTFSLLNGEIWRSYPIYREGDTQAKPSGGLARYRYDLSADRWVAGE